jgi:ERCC4-type nuclease
MCKLIIDTRERYITRHTDCFAHIETEIRQIVIGDYAVVAVIDGIEYILASIERKTFEDYAASIKDGRYSNKDKMVDLRNKTGARLIYIIEGKAFPQPSEQFGRISYKHIESSIFHLMVRDNICVLRTKDTLDTAQTLARFVLSMQTLCAKSDVPTLCIGLSNTTSTVSDSIVSNSTCDSIVSNSTCDSTSSALDNTTKIACSVMLQLMEKNIKSDACILREMWAVIPGISIESASDYIKRWTIMDVLTNQIPYDTRLDTGRKITKKVSNSIRNLNKQHEIRMLAIIPGISRATAKDILVDNTILRLVTYPVEAISIIKVGVHRRNLGISRAQNIIKYFTLRLQ